MVESSCGRIREKVNEPNGSGISPLQSSETSCETAATIFDRVVYEDRTHLLDPNIDPRLFRRKVQSLWSDTYFIPLIRSTTAGLCEKKMAASAAEKKLTPFIRSTWSNLDAEVLKKTFRELAALSNTGCVSPSVRASLVDLAQMVAKPLGYRHALQDEATESAYQSLLDSTDPKLQAAGLGLLEVTLNQQPVPKPRSGNGKKGSARWERTPPQYVSAYHKRALQALATMLVRPDLQPKVFTDAVQLMGRAGHLLSPHGDSKFSSREKVAEFLFGLVESKNTAVAQKGMVVLALDALDHHDRALWSPALVKRLMEIKISKSTSDKETSVLAKAIHHYILARLQSVIIENASDFSAGQFISTEASGLFRLLEGYPDGSAPLIRDFIAAIMLSPDINTITRKHLLAVGAKWMEDKPAPDILQIMIAGAIITMINIAQKKHDTSMNELLWMKRFVLNRLPVDEHHTSTVMNAFSFVGSILQYNAMRMKEQNQVFSIPPELAMIIGQWLIKKGMMDPLLTKLDTELSDIPSDIQIFIAQGLRAVLPDLPKGNLYTKAEGLLGKIDLAVARK